MRFLNGSVTNVVVAQVVVKLIVTSALLAGYLGGLRLAAQSVRVLVELGFGRKRAGCHVRERDKVISSASAWEDERNLKGHRDDLDLRGHF